MILETLEIKSMNTRRQFLKEFLANNPGWHTAEAIASAVGSSPIANLADNMCIGANACLEKNKGLGRGNQTQYKLKN